MAVDIAPRAQAAGPPSLAAWLAAVRGHLAPALTGEEHLSQVEVLARRLPAESLAALEIRLGGDAGVDLSVRLLSPASCRRAARGLRRVTLHHLAATWEDDPTWARAVSAVWLELDLAHGAVRGEREPAPIVCARIEHSPDRDGPPDPTWITRSLVPALSGHRPTPPQEDRIQRILYGLPSSARLLYVFDLFARGRREIRLELFGPARDDLVAFVRRITGGRGADRAAEALEVLGDLDRLHLSLDVGPEGEVSKRIGIDGSYRRLPAMEPRWRELFDRLVAEGLCLPEKRDAALGWPGVDSFWTAPGRWPLPGGGVGGHCVRALSHVKLVTHPGVPLEAKVYLIVSHVVR